MATLHQLQRAFVKADDAGETEDAQFFADSIRQHPTYQKQGQEALAKGFKALSGDERKQAIHQSTAKALGIKPSDLDSERGMGVWGRTKLSFQPTEQDKVKHLEDTYGRENIRGVDIGGDIQFLYRDDDETMGKWRRVDEQGISLADFTADIAGVAPEIGGAIVGGVKGAAAGTAVAPGVGTVVGGVLGAAAGGFTAGSAQDVAVRAASGEDIQLGEIGERRLKEAGTGALLDVGMLGLGRVGSKFLRRANLKEAAGDAFAESVDIVRREGGYVPETAGLKAGGDVLESERTIEAFRPQAKTSRQRQASRESMQDLVEGMTGNQNAFDAASRIQSRIASRSADLDDLVRQSEKKSEGLIGDARQELVDRFSVTPQEIDRFGGDVQRYLENAGQGADNVASQLYARRKELAEAGNVGATKNQILREIDKAIKDMPRFDSSELQKVRARINGGDDFIPFEALDDELANIRSAIADGATTQSPTGRLASAAAENVANLRERVATKAGTEFAGAHADANRFFKDDALGFRRGPIGAAIKEVAGDYRATNSQVAQAIFRDPETIREVIQSLKFADDTVPNPSAFMKEARRQYLGQVGFEKGINPSVAKKLSKNQREVMAQLWSDPRAQGITQAGRRKVDQYQELMAALDKSKVKMAQLSANEVDEYMSALSINARRDIKNELVGLAKKRERLADFQQSAIIKEVLKGGDDWLLDPKFGDAMANKMTAKQAQDFIGMVDNADLPFVRQNLVEGLLRRSSGEPGLGWNADTMRKTLNARERAFRSILGDSQYKLLHSINDVQERLAAAAKSGQEGKVGVRTIFSEGGVKGYLSGDIINNLKNRFLGWAYGTGVIKDLFVKGSAEKADASFRRALGAMIGTPRGLQALNQATQDDPQARAAIIREFGESEQ